MSSRGVFNLKTKTIMAYAFRIKFYIFTVSALGLFFMTANTASAATYTVTSTADSGASTFRQAITDANANPGADEIAFNISGTGPHEIVTTDYLPQLEGKTFLNGASQPGTICGTNNMQPQIIIKGFAHIDFAETATDSSMRGIALPDWQDSHSPSMYIGGDGFSLTCSMFGTQDGTALGSSGRLQVLGTAQNVTIGGDDDSDRNIFATVAYETPLRSEVGSTGIVKNNYFGVRPDGVTRLAPTTGTLSGLITLYDSSIWSLEGNIIAGATASQSALITNHGTMTLKGNYIGTDKSKTVDLGGTGPAILTQYSGASTLVGGVSPADKNYIYNYDTSTAAADDGIVTAIGNEFINNQTPIDKTNTPVIVNATETGGNTQYTIFLDYNFDNNQDYRIELFSNDNLVNSKGGLDTQDQFAVETVSKTIARQLFTFEAIGTGHTNPTITATAIDDNSDSGFGQTSKVGQQFDNTDIQIETTDGVTSVEPGTNDHEITQTFTNLGPSTVTRMDFGGLNSTCFTINTITESGTATDAGTYNNLVWNGVLEQNQTLILTFSGGTNCLSGSIDFSHGHLDYLYNGSDHVYETSYENNDYEDKDTVITTPETDLAITNTLNNPEDVAIGKTLNYTLTLTNTGPEDFDIGRFDGSGQNPFDSSIFMNFVPFELNFIGGSSTNADIACGVLADTNNPGVTSFLGNHPDHDIIKCSYGAGSTILAQGQSISTTVSFVVDGSSDLSFATHAMTGYAQYDPDLGTMNNGFSFDNECSGYTDMIDCFAGTGINNYAAAGPTTDLRIAQTLVNTGDIAENDTVNYDVTITNDGPNALDLASLDGSNSGQNSLLGDVYPAADLTFVDDDNANVSCTDFGASSNAYLGAAGQDHTTHQLINCYYSGSSQMLNSGSSLTVRLSFTAKAGVGTSFTNYAVFNGATSDPDSAVINAAFGGASEDILDTFTNENFSKHSYVAPSSVTDLRIAKSLVNTGDIRAGDTVSYDIALTNDGPADLDLSTLDGSNSGRNSLFNDIYPGADLAFVDDNNANVTCSDLGPGSYAYMGPAAQDHTTHQLMSCVYSGSSQMLTSGSTLTVRLSFTANVEVGSSFTNYVSHTGSVTDPDLAAINSIFSSATGDILDTITNENIAKSTYTSNDNDNDGISNSVEDDGPNSGDANNDGTLDSLQNNVTSIVNSTTNKRAVLAVSSDCSITTATVVAESANTEQDPTYVYPVGLMDFELACGTPGYTADITQYYFDASNQDYVVRKYNANNDNYSDIDSAVITEETIADKPVVKASYQITDGNSLDMDNTVDGNIKDPAGLAKVDSSESQASTSQTIKNRIIGSLASTGQSIAIIVILAGSLIVGGVVAIRKNFAK